MMSFRKLLSPKRQKEIAEMNEYYERDLIKFRNMNTSNLIATAKYYMTQMKEPYKYDPGVCVYDASFWHLIIPEMIRRLTKKSPRKPLSP